MDKEREKLVTYLMALETYSEAIYEASGIIEQAVRDGILNDEVCETIKNMFQSRTAKMNLSEVNLTCMQILRAIKVKTQ